MSHRVQLIDALTTALQARFKSLKVEAFPDEPKAYSTHPVGALLVAYLGGRYDAPFSLDLVAQDAHEQFGITVQFRQLNGRAGAVGVVDDVAGFVTGLALDEGMRLRLQRVEFVRHVDGLWEYQVIVATTTVQMESRAADSAPPLTLVDYVHDETMSV